MRTATNHSTGQLPHDIQHHILWAPLAGLKQRPVSVDDGLHVFDKPRRRAASGMQITHQPERYALLRRPRASGASVHKIVAGKGSHSVALAWYNKGFFEFNPDVHDLGLGARLALPVQLAQCLVSPFRIQTSWPVLRAA